MAARTWGSPTATRFVEVSALRHRLRSPASTTEGNWAKAEAVVALAVGVPRFDWCESERVESTLSHRPLLGAFDEDSTRGPLLAKLADETHAYGVWHTLGARRSFRDGVSWLSA